MILVKNRELLVPENERFIGTTYDHLSENRQFKLPRVAQNGVDLSALTFRLDLKYSNDSYDTVILSKEIEDEYLVLTWEILSAVQQVPGTLYIALRAADGENTVRWASFGAVMYVERHLNTPGNYTGDPTEIEQMELDHEYFKRVIQELESHLDYAHDAEAWATGNRSGEAVPSTDETYHNNAKYYKEQAASGAGSAKNFSLDAEAWAKGTREGTAVTSGQDGYHDNAKYYKDQAEAVVADTNTRFNNAIAAVTVDTEVQDARVGVNGSAYTVLKSRLDSEHNDLQNQLDKIGVFVSPDVTWESGSIYTSTGQEYNDSTCIRTGFFKLVSDRIKVTFPADFYHSADIFIYNSASISSYVESAYTHVHYSSSGKTFDVPAGKYCRVVYEETASGGGNPQPEDITLVQLVRVDETLTQAGAAADAKVTGDGISRVKSHLALFTDDGKVLKDFVWEQGSIASDTGLDSDDGSTKRCRTAGYYSTDCEEIVVDRSIVPYGVFLYYYDENHNFVSPRSSVYISSSITPNKNYPYFRIAVYYYGHDTWAISAIDCANRIKIKNTAEIVNDINADIVKAVGAEDTKTNILHDLVNYNYDEAANLAEESGSNTGRCIGIVRNGTIVKLSGTSAISSGYDVVIRLSGSVRRNSSHSFEDIDGWNENPVTFISGHTYRVKIKTLSGTSTRNGVIYLPSVSVYKVGTHVSIGTPIRKDTEFIREFTPDVSTYNIAIYIDYQTVLTDYVASVTIEDCTLAEEHDIKGLRSPLTLADADYNFRKVTASATAKDDANGTRLRIIYKLDYPFSFSTQCVEGGGLYVALFETLGDAVKASASPIKLFTPAYTTDIVNGESEQIGYLSISLKKEDNGVISDADRAALEAATNISILLYPLNVVEQMRQYIDPTTATVNADMNTALVAASGYNTYASGNYNSATGRKKNLTLAVITDLHGSSNALKRCVDYANDKHDYIDAVVCLGDIVPAAPSSDTSWFESDIAESTLPVLFTVGNHDVAFSGGAAITQEAARSRYFAAIESNAWITNFQDDSLCSWYKDFDDYDIRIISLYEYGNADTASRAPVVYCRRWIDSDTLQWFADTLYTTPAGYSVVVLLHQMPFYPVSFVEGAFTVAPALRDLHTLQQIFLNTVNGNPIEDIVNAFMNSSEINTTYSSISSYHLEKTATISKDFSDRSENGKFICYVCGHTHASYISKSVEYPAQTIVSVPSGSENIYQRKYGDTNYDFENRNQDNFYVIGFNTDHHAINVIQIGGQETIDMRKRDMIAVSYLS